MIMAWYLIVNCFLDALCYYIFTYENKLFIYLLMAAPHGLWDLSLWTRIGPRPRQWK